MAEQAPVKILLVDDDTDLLQVLAEELSETRDVLTAASGPAALELIRSEASPDEIGVIISDCCGSSAMT